MTNTKKIRITAYIDADVISVLRECVFLKNAIRSEIITEAITQYLYEFVLRDLNDDKKLTNERYTELKNLLNPPF